MRYIGVKEAATKWNISERSVRNYCTNGRIPGAVLGRENVGYTGRCSKATEEETDREDRNRFTVTFENGKRIGYFGWNIS